MMGVWASRAGGVRVFVPLVPREEEEIMPEPRELDVRELIACPTCHARVTECCRTPSGHTTTDHSSRLVPRRCECGAELPGPRRRYCDECRDRRLQTAKNEHGRLRRQAARARFA